MIGFLLRFRKNQSAPVTTIPLKELAALWRDPVEPKTVAKKEKIPKPSDEPVEAESPPVDLTTLIGADKNPRANDNDSWFDKKALLATLQSRISEGCISAFVYQGSAYYALGTVSKALNEQRRNQNYELLKPNEVIAFFKSETERGLSSGKYLLRFDNGLPVKIYLYTHPGTGEKASEPVLPVDETGRRLKSLKPIKVRTP